MVKRFNYSRLKESAPGGLFYWKARRAGWRRRRVDGVLRWVME